MEGINDIISNHRRRIVRILTNNGRRYTFNTSPEEEGCGASENEMGNGTDLISYSLK